MHDVGTGEELLIVDVSELFSASVVSIEEIGSIISVDTLSVCFMEDIFWVEDVLYSFGEALLFGPFAVE